MINMAQLTNPSSEKAQRAAQALAVAKSWDRDKMLPGSQNLFRTQGQDLTIMHVPTGYKVKFPAFLDNLNDAYTSKWVEESVFGRMDPISVFSHTDRVLSLAWNVPADSFEHAESNLGRVNQLISFLYPLYDRSQGSGGATDINQGPLVRLSFGNLVKASNATGLLGYAHGVTFDPIFDYGMFSRKKTAGPRTADPQDNEYYPKSFRLNMEFTVLHEHDLGFQVLTKQQKRFQPVGTSKRGERFTFHARDVDFNNFPYKTTGAEATTIRSQEYIRYPRGNLSVDQELPPVPLTDGEKVAMRERRAWARNGSGDWVGTPIGSPTRYAATDKLPPAPPEMRPPTRWGPAWVRPRW
jgi:hypothetical protein